MQIERRVVACREGEGRARGTFEWEVDREGVKQENLVKPIIARMFIFTSIMHQRTLDDWSLLRTDEEFKRSHRTLAAVGDQGRGTLT